MALTKVSTDGVKDDAITSGKIPANAVGASELADNAVDTNAIANNAVTAGKTSGVATTINNNADNRVITGSGTANTLNGESQLTYNGTLKNSVAAENGTIAQFELSGQTNNPALLIKADESDQQITFRAGASTSTYPSVAFNMGTVGDAVIIDSSGKVGIGKDNPVFLLEVKGATNDTIRLNHSGETASGSHDVKIVAGGSHYQNIHFEGSNIFYKTYNGSSVGERFRIRSTGGITFNGDTADANALDDYEEGTWTPDFNANISESNVSSRYVKIGRSVTAQFYVNIAGSFGGAAGASDTSLIISGLPYAADTNAFHLGVIDVGNGGAAGAYLRVSGGSSTMSVLVGSGSVGTPRTHLRGNTIGTGDYVIGSITYQTA